MNYLIKGETLDEIANAIREKTDTSDIVPVTEMAALIRSIRTSAVPILESITITPTGKEINEIPAFGSDGFGMVTVTGDENLISENIKTGVFIYGVEGSLATDNGGIDTTDATATADDILEAATAYVNGVKIKGTHVCPPEPILRVLYAMPTGKEYTEYPPDGEDGFSEVLIEGDPNLIPENILAGTTIYGVDGNVAFESVEVTPGAEPIDLEPSFGYSAFDSVYIEGDSNLVPENIVKGNKIFGVEGTALAESDMLRKLQKKDVTPTADDIVLKPEEDYYGFSEVTIEGDPHLVPENIVEGVDIFGVTGTAVVHDSSDSGDYDQTMFVMPFSKLIFEEIDSGELSDIKKLQKDGYSAAAIAEELGMPITLVQAAIAKLT